MVATLILFKMLNLGYWGGNIIIFNALFNNFLFSVDTYYCHWNIWD
jgi:hypothetical protein